MPLLVDKNWRWLQGDVVCVLRVKACTCLALQQERRALSSKGVARRPVTLGEERCHDYLEY